jgi:hypothetical protein
MQQERCRDLVRTLTRLVVERLSPGKLATFEEDFAASALSAGVPQAHEKAELLGSREQGLDTTLVAGMFFEVLLKAAHLPASTPERVSFVRKEAKNYLVTRLAGQISLSRFFRLLNLIDENVYHYFHSLGRDWAGVPHVCPGEPDLPRPGPEPIRGEELRQALGQLPLPQTGGRKLNLQTLWEFLRGTEGRWFRLLDFEASFRVNKKTAWGYLTLLLRSGILEHNGEKANRVRYALAGRFRL